ncbi:MAG: hypothetical protein GF387_02250 [Candidatus Portnoybacteria bacterium]|nr:hypothetical protein [Candidatus Portnoybacteria bacterium]
MIYSELVSLKNLFRAWDKFSLGKSRKEDMIKFWNNLEDNIFELHKDLKGLEYRHGAYERFVVNDPKKRIIHKAEVRDRVVHQIVFDYLGVFFEKSFIFDSYSSRINKGTHRAVKRLNLFCRKAYFNNPYTCWALKCDINKFFDNIDHCVLFNLIKRKIKDVKALMLVEKILKSFGCDQKGLPLGNLTSQLFANIYLNELDYFIKNILKIKKYVRFNDDFVIVCRDRDFLESIILKFKNF